MQVEGSCLPLVQHRPPSLPLVPLWAHGYPCVPVVPSRDETLEPCPGCHRTLPMGMR